MENVAQTKRYSKSEFVRYSRDAMQVLSEDIDIVRTWRALIGNHTILAPNYWKVHRKHLSKCKYFIVDVKDIECLEQTMNSVNSHEERKRMIFRFRSLSSWMQVYENHNLYLRAIPSGHNGIKDAPRVFAEDLLEIIPIVLEKQGMPKSLGNDRIEDYRNKWASSLEGKVWITVSTKEMAGLFDDLDCNKELVTIIEDPSHINTSRDVMERGGYIRTISPNQTEVMDTSMAALYIFDTLVKGRNHKKYRCDGSLCGKEDGMDCLKRITKLLNWVMEDTGAYISVEYLRTQIDIHLKISHECANHPGPFADYTFNHFPYAERLDIIAYMFTARIYDLLYYANFLDAEQQNSLPVWMANVFIGLGWLEQFFGDSEKQMKEFLGRAMLSMVPTEKKDQTWIFISQMISRIFKGCEVYPSALDKMHMFPMSKSQKKSQKRKNRKEKERLAKLNPDTVYEDDFEEEDEEDLEASESQISGSMSEMPHDIEKQIDEDLAKFAEELEIEDEKEDGKKNSKEEKIQLLKRHYQMVSNESKALVAEIKKLREQLELQQGLQEMNPDEKDDIIKELVKENQDLGARNEELIKKNSDIKKENDELMEKMTDECNKYMAVLHNIHVSDREALEKYDSENHDLKLKITHQQETINQLIKSLKTSD